MNLNENKVEAILFAVGKEISTERIANLCSLSSKDVEIIMRKLVADYDKLENSLKIVRKENGWKLTVRDEFIPLVSNIVSSTELETPLMETLAVIAWRYPVVQSEVIKLRGTGAYEHMKQLEERGFIVKERAGRTFTVKLTKKFFEYFDLPSDEAKKAFLKQVPPAVLQEAEEVQKEADEVERLIELDKKEVAAKEEIDKALENIKQ